MTAIELEGLGKTHARGVVGLHALHLRIEPGELLVVLGPSGSGKSTLLRLIAGLDQPTTGHVRIGGQDVTGLPPHVRGVGLVFQTPALLPHLSVAENLAFPLRAGRVAAAAVAERVGELARRLELEPLLSRRPGTLSGGERQRAALGRAIARKPRVLLLDEPFSSLDPPLRAALREELIRTHLELGATTILVTHDQEEAMAVADRIAVLDHGRLLQCGPPRTLYNRPLDCFVARFIGSPRINFLNCRLRPLEHGVHVEVLETDPPLAWHAPLREDAPRDAIPAHATLGLRPEHVRIVLDPLGTNGAPSLAAVVERVEYAGNDQVAWLRAGTLRLCARMPAATSLSPSAEVQAALDVRQGIWFDQGGRAFEL